MEARDIMTKDVITLSPDMSVEEATDVLLRYRIHGAPVTTPEGQLLGMVSFMDLARRAGEDARVEDIMTPDPVVAQEDTPVEEIARLMLDQMVRRIPIVRAGKVVGIVSASDIVQLFLNLHEAPRPRGPERAARTGR
ncbi:MAG: CBS domain-containing protein [Armatimonadota bacterium]|nr:CBS domain-containing protein [Armatimonadota bacterium]MDR7402184.1 CBS domain-containing protein [Armatimonadota bacterium]MDR7404634.1 CBS domain-containing protein [Armatimonadota bacterium]MDR7436941.1 CBS domain-containing protein [Armatimonadota bacterium]MDR7472285.1 CBS domain-containing protein [Armatimonadota bacterium]